MKLKIKNLFIYIFVLMYILTTNLSYSQSIYAEPDENSVETENDSTVESDDESDEDSDKETGQSSEESSESNSSLWPEGPTVKAKTAVLLDAESGAVLYEKKKDKQMYPASITKILTCLLTLENCKLDEKVKMSHYAIFNVPYSYAHIGLKEGEEISVEDCLYGLMLQSANEVAFGLAEHISGTVDDFSKLMNERAKEAGATNSNFVNPNGIPNENHYTSAMDMALITKAALKYPEFEKIISTKMYVIGKTKMTKEKRYNNNFHRMIYEDNDEYYPGIIGGKTGYTEEAGNTLVTVAERDGRKLICVVLKSKDKYEDTKKLFDFGYKSFKSVEIDESAITSPTGMCYNKLAQALGKGYMSVSYPNGNYLTLPADAKEDDISYEITLVDKDSSEKTTETTKTPANETTEVKSDSPAVAVVKYYYDSKEVGSIDIGYKVNATSKEEDKGGSGLFKNITKKKPVSFFGSSLMKAARLLGLILIITLLILLILAIRIAHINRVNKKRKDERRRKRLEIRERERREQEESYQRDRDHRTNRDNHIK